MLIILILINNIETFAFSDFSEDIETSGYAVEITKISSSEFKDPTEDPDYWKPVASQETELAEKAGVLLGVINVLGVVSAVIALVLLGMKYFLGSVQEKAEFKNSFGIYILGIVLLVLCTTLPNIIYNVSQEVFK